MNFLPRILLACLLAQTSNSIALATPVLNWVVTNGDSVFLDNSAATSSPIVTDADSDTIIGSFPSVTLAVDDSIVMTGSFNITGGTGTVIPGNQMRWALFDAPGVPETGVGSGYVGIWASLSTAGTAGLRSADGSAVNPFTGSASTNIINAPTGGSARYGTTYSFSLTITRINESQISVAASITDGASLNIVWPETATSASPTSFTYDSVGILIGGTVDATTATFSNIEVSIPETESLAITDIEYIAESNSIAITFTSTPGKEYTVDTSPDLTAWTGDIRDDVVADPDDTTTRFEFPVTDFGTRQFFRVRENPA